MDFLASAIALFVTAAMDKRWRAVWFNVACISIGLGIFEYYLWASGQRGFAFGRVYEGNSADVIVPHRQLGWAPQPDSVVREKLTFEDELLYDATYTIGPIGLRISAPSINASYLSSKCILFFGGSFTFGQGLADHQTLPFLVHERSGQRYRTYNFGVNGYGAHQMLSALQHGRVQDAVECDRTQVTHVFYQAITDHIARSAGPRWWWTRGPRYVLAGNGEVRLDGRFEDHLDDAENKSLIQLIGTQISKSMIYQRIVRGRYAHQYSRHDIDLYLGVVDEARRVARSDFLSAEFHALLWDEDNLDNRTIRAGLRQRGLDVHLMSDILPNYRADDLNMAYRLHERDPHPNALANELIAQYVIDEILESRGPERDLDTNAPASSDVKSPPQCS